MNIYLIRHGQTPWNKENRIQGHEDTSLTEIGKEQAKKLANRLLNKDIKVIYSSDLKRAYETGKIISEIIKAPIYADERLRELDMGDWCGKLTEEITIDPKNDYDRWMREPENYQIPNGEKLITRYKLVENFFNDILETKSDNILIVSHGITVKLAILYLINGPLTLYKNLSMDNVALNLIRLRDYNNVLTLYNDTCHLKE